LTNPGEQDGSLGVRSLAVASRWAWLNALLDGVALLVAAAIFAQLSDPDVLFHVIWVILTLEAFAFGLRVTGIRIGLAVGLILVYSWVASTNPSGIPLSLVELELSEWPLMLIIIIVVAVMADRVSSMSRRYATLYRQANDRLLTAQEDERKRLALDLHDGVGQVLTALTLTLDAAENLLWADADGPPRHAEAALTRSQQLAAMALEETHDVAFRLRPARIVETGLAASLRELARASSASIDVVVDPSVVRPGLLPPEMELEAFRIAQEAIGNALRHANAKRIRIGLAENRDGLRLDISDDGLGFDPRKVADRGLGLAGMRERAAVIGAGLEVVSRIGRGSRVTLQIPMKDHGSRSTQPAREPQEQMSIS